MAREPKKDDSPEAEAQADVVAPAQPATTNLSAGEAAELMSTTVQKMRQQWLQSAVTIANVLKNGQTVHRASFDDLRHVRENYEELERARLLLQNMAKSADQSGETGRKENGN